MARVQRTSAEQGWPHWVSVAVVREVLGHRGGGAAHGHAVLD